MHASLLGCALESYVIDNDMLGAIQRTVRGLEVDEETLSFETIREVVTGEGHFLGHEQTIAAMTRDYLYPEVGDRASPADWTDAGALDMRARARARTKEILASHFPDHIDRACDAAIRRRFAIQLPETAMRAAD